uniref:Uncharacterized protein n=1 Tax=Parascaris univalens TaxID=6257 RepID=A0A915BMR2_PARUN
MCVGDSVLHLVISVVVKIGDVLPQSIVSGPVGIKLICEVLQQLLSQFVGTTKLTRHNPS